MKRHSRQAGRALWVLGLCLLFLCSAGCRVAVPQAPVTTGTATDGATAVTTATPATEVTEPPTGTPTAAPKATASAADRTRKATVTTAATTTRATVPPTPAGAADNYGRNQLATLPNGATLVAIYDRLAAGVAAMAPRIDWQNGGYRLTKEEFSQVVAYYRADYPEHFWRDDTQPIAYSLRGSTVVNASFVYSCTAAELPARQAQFEAACQTVLSLAAAGADDYEREQIVHDYLIETVTYEETADGHTAYGALVGKKAICEGYTRAFQYLMHRLNIPCLFVQGTAVTHDTETVGDHCWNMVNIGGNYYHVDVTWDDANRPEYPVMHPYFNLTTAQISEDHTVLSDYGYTVPLCTATAANYHVVNGTVLTEYSVSRVAELLAAHGGTVAVFIPGDVAAFKRWFAVNYRAIARATGQYGATGSSLRLWREVQLSLI